MTPQQAKQFILKRIQAQDSINNAAKKHLLSAAKDIVRMAWRYHSQGQRFQFSKNSVLNARIEARLKEMRKAITKDMEALAVYAADEYSEKEDKAEDEDDAVAFLYLPFNDRSLNQLLQEYSDRFKHELEAVIAAAFAFAVTERALNALLTAGMQNIYSWPLFKRALSRGGFSAIRLARGIPNYGNGQYRQAVNSIVRLVTDTVGRTWMWFLGVIHKRQGYRFFYSRRGSSYPCRTCDAEQAAGVRPIEEYTGLYHNNCKCVFYFL